MTDELGSKEEDLERIKRIASSIRNDERKLKKIYASGRTDEQTRAVIFQFKKGIRAGFIAIDSIEKTMATRAKYFDLVERHDEIVAETKAELIKHAYKALSKKYGLENNLSDREIDALLKDYLKNKEARKL